MRTRFSVLAALLCGLTLSAPVLASAAPHHNRGLTINAVPNPITAGEGVLIYGQLLGPQSSGQTIRLYHRVPPAGRFTLVSVTTTGPSGQYEFARAEGLVLTNRSWFVRGPAATHSRTIHERVSALVSLHASTMTAQTRQRVIFRGIVVPAHRFQRVLLQEHDSAASDDWHTIAATFTNGLSRFVLAHAWIRPGDYTLRALFTGDPRNVAGASDSVTLQVQQRQNPRFTLTSSSPIIPEGQAVTLSGVLTPPSGTTASTGTEVVLYGATAGGPFRQLGTTTTQANGSYSFNLSPVYNTVYRVRTATRPMRSTAELAQGVQDVVTISATSSTSTVGGSVTISGSVSPSKVGHVIYLQRLGLDGDWHNVARTVVGTGSTYSFSHTFGEAGPSQLRTRIYGGPANIGAASSPVTITVSGVAPVTSLPPAS